MGGNDVESSAGSGSGTFSTFWQKGLEKVGRGKSGSKSDRPKAGVSKPGENGRSGNDKADTEVDNLTPKQRRRAQVRKAQIEHRQRKENYVKHLEQDVIELREMIAAATTQAVLFKHENAAIKAALAEAQAALGTKPPTLAPPIPATASTTSPEASIYEPLDFSSFKDGFKVPAWDTNTSSSETTLVSTTFDEWIDTSCLQIDPWVERDELMTDVSGLPSDLSALDSSVPGQDLGSVAGSQRELPALPAAVKSAEVELSMMAVNFILALEHPCRTHFHAPSLTFDPEGAPSGHELLASTLLYCSAPPKIFSSSAFKDPFPIVASNGQATHSLSARAPTRGAEELKWAAPPLELSTLHEMASSLPKSDWEITPVQAWFRLAERYDAKRLLDTAQPGQSGREPGKGKINGVEEKALDRLKRGLSKIVDCYAFGAVMDERKFWDVVESELGTGSRANVRV